MPRGRLIYPFLVEIAPLDTAATEADPDGAGPLTSGYDEDFRVPVTVLADPSDQVGESARVEGTSLSLKAQIEPDQFERLQMMLSGESPESRFAIILHYKEIESLGLLDTDGRPTIKKSDRLVKISELDGTLVERIPDPPGLYVHEVQSIGWGLGSSKRNLLKVTFEERAVSSSRG